LWIFPITGFFSADLKEAVVAQREMALKIVQKNDFKKPPAMIAGVDISCNRLNSDKKIFVAISLISYLDLAS